MPADKPSHGFDRWAHSRPDAEGLARTAEELQVLEPLTTPYMAPFHQFASAGRGLSDSQRSLEKPSAADRKRGLCLPALVGGITFALDLLQAFNRTRRLQSRVVSHLPEVRKICRSVNTQQS